MRSYVIFPELEERINKSGLVERFSEIGEKPHVGRFCIENIKTEVLENPYSLPLDVRARVYKSLGEKSNWKIQSGQGNPDLFGNPVFETIKYLSSDLLDLALGTGYLLPNPEDDEGFGGKVEFDKKELRNWEKYGFISPLDMIMSLSAYRCRQVLQLQRNQYEWINSRGVRNVITACVNGDPKFFQYKEVVDDRIVSPFGNEVLFSPREMMGNMSHVHHSHEPEFFATFFRYTIEIGKLDEIMGENANKFLAYADLLTPSLGNYGDAGSNGYMDESSFLFRVAIPIGGIEGTMRNSHTHSFSPGIGQGFLKFKKGENNELQIFDNSGVLVMKFFPEGAEYLLKGILHQCAHGHGRTSKEQILNLVKFYYSGEFERQKTEFDL